MFRFTSQNKILSFVNILPLVFVFLLVFPFVGEANFNQQINYQGKLTDSSGVAVADGDYNMNFWLVASSTAATSTAEWSEARTGVNKVTVTNGLFSVMLGEVSSLISVDFNQTLYLAVEIGGTGTLSWDGEMSPRKILGAVPAAFEAKNAQTLDGIATSSFLRSDQADALEATSSSAMLTVIQNGAGKLLSLFSGATELFTVLNNGNVGIATTTPDSKFTVVGNSYLSGNITITGDAYITGVLRDSTNASGTAGMILQTTGTGTQWVATSSLGITGGASNFVDLSDVSISSLTANRVLFTDSGGSAVTDSANFTFDGTNLGLGVQSYLAFGDTNYLYASSTNDSLIFGENAGATFNSGTTFNTAIGYEAGRYASTTNSDNNYLGRFAGYSNVGSNNNLIGQYSGRVNTGFFNEMIGYQTGYNLQATSSVIIGGEAYRGGAGTTAFQAVNNTILGYRAGYAAQTGSSNNIFLGYQAADNLTTGANNIVIGYDVDIASTTGSNQLNIGNLIFGTGIDGTGTSVSSGNVGVGTTTPEARLAIERLNYSEAGVAGLDQYFSFTNNTASAIQYANRSYIYATNTATTTMVGNIIRLNDSTSYGNTVRGFEVQTDRGTNTLGENTALSGFARTFGVRGVTSGDAGGTYEPAGVFAETEGTTQGNAIRGYSSTITSTALLKLFQDTSTFTGTGLLMNFGNSGGSFASTTASKFIDLQNAGTTMFTVDPYGMLTIGNGTTTQNAGIQVGYGGICVDNDGSCNASTTGQISAVSYYTGNSDLAEMYFSSESLEPGDVIYTKGGLSIGKANDDSKSKIVGVVSTKPGMVLGFDDSSLNKNEKGFPVALSGRVPVKLSNENGPIKAGDELMLSSVPGIAMKATSTGRIIGVALEDFDESKAYSKTYINQFGDDLIDSVFVPQNQNTDPKQNNGCYNSGGVATGDSGCVSEADDDEIKEIKPIVLYEEELETLDKLAKKPSEKFTTEEGRVVRVGQAIMFVDIRYRYLDNRQLEVIDNLLVSAEVAGDMEKEKEKETVWERLVQLANNFIDGVLSVLKLKADKVDIKEELCVDGVCINGDDLRILLEQSRLQNYSEEEANSSLKNEEPVEPVTKDDDRKEEENESTDYQENTDEGTLEDDSIEIDTIKSSSTDSNSINSSTSTENIIENQEAKIEKSTSTIKVDDDKKVIQVKDVDQEVDIGQKGQETLHDDDQREEEGDDELKEPEIDKSKTTETNTDPEEAKDEEIKEEKEQKQTQETKQSETLEEPEINIVN